MGNVLLPLWNGWILPRRMRAIGDPHLNAIDFCQARCGVEENSIEHYRRCKTPWDFVWRPRPGGLGLVSIPRCPEVFLVHDGLNGDDRIRTAFGLHGLYQRASYLNHIVQV